MANIKESFIPLEAVHPTDMLKDEMKARGITGKDMAARLGMQSSNFSRMLKHKETITSQMANKLEEALGIPASMWLNMQAGYERDVMDIQNRNREEAEYAMAEKILSGVVNLALVLKKLSIDGYVFAKDRMEFLYNTFRVQSVERLVAIAQPSGCFKKSEKTQTDEKNLNAWILLAYAACMNDKVTQPYTQGNVQLAAKDIADETNRGTITELFIKTKLNEYGIGYCHVEKVPKAPVDAYSTMTDGVPYIVTSHRHDNMDMLVFDVLHELHHIDKDLSNGDSNISCNGDRDKEKDERELAANKFAEDTLIPQAVWARLMKTQSASINPYSIYMSIVQEAKKQGISPSIAAWRYKFQTKIYNVKGNQSPKIR